MEPIFEVFASSFFVPAKDPHNRRSFHLHTIISALVQWNLSMEDILNKGHLSNADNVCCLNHIELCTNLPLN